MRDEIQMRMEFYDELGALKRGIDEAEYYLDGILLDKATEDKVLDCIEDVEAAVSRLCQLAEDIFNAANAQA